MSVQIIVDQNAFEVKCSPAQIHVALCQSLPPQKRRKTVLASNKSLRQIYLTCLTLIYYHFPGFSPYEVHV